MEFLHNIWNRINNSLFNKFSGRDKRQVLSLIAVLMLTFAVNYCIRRFGSHDAPEFNDEIKNKIALLDQRLASLRDGDTLSRLDRYIVQRYDTLQLFEFDPNTISQDQLLLLGFTEKQAGNLVNYRNNGGRFRVPDDLRKLYGMRTMQFKILKPYITIAGATAVNTDQKSDHTKPDTHYENQSNVASTDSPDKNVANVYFDFDPNTISAEDLQRLGFSEKQAASIINWRTKGKKFYVARDFASAYCVDDKKYRELEPYIHIDLPKLLGGKRLLDINTATADDLISIGLTADEAAKIIDFREKVGYYFANWQIEDALTNRKRANELKSSFYVCASVDIRKINANTTPPDLLESHPYFSAQQAAAVVQLRETQKITSTDDLKKTGLFTDKELKRIANYLTY